MFRTVLSRSLVAVLIAVLLGVAAAPEANAYGQGVIDPSLWSNPLQCELHRLDYR